MPSPRRFRHTSHITLDILLMLAVVSCMALMFAGCAVHRPVVEAPSPDIQAPRVFDPGPSAEGVPPAVFEDGDIRAYAMRVENARGSGTGTLIEIGGKQYVLTAAHVITDIAEPTFAVMPRWDAARGDFVLHRVLCLVTGKNDELDLALLSPLGPIERRVAVVAAVNPPVGTHIMSVGLPSRTFGFGLVTSGIIASSGISNELKTVFHTDSQSVPGCSGGGIFNDKLELVAIVQRTYPGTTLTWCTAVDDIRAFLSQSGHPYP